MVVKSLNEYMTDQLVDRIKTLQKALNQAEKIIMIFEAENRRLKDALISFSSENFDSYVMDSEAFDEPICI